MSSFNIHFFYLFFSTRKKYCRSRAQSFMFDYWLYQWIYLHFPCLQYQLAHYRSWIFTHFGPFLVWISVKLTLSPRCTSSAFVIWLMWKNTSSPDLVSTNPYPLSENHLLTIPSNLLFLPYCLFNALSFKIWSNKTRAQ